MIRALVIFVGLMLPCTSTRAETLILSLATHQIAISSSFSGAQLAIFGAVERDGRTIARAESYDLVITVMGPRGTTVVREKEALGPLWVNQGQRRFVETPGFLWIGANRALSEIITPQLARRERIGLSNLLIPRGTGFDVDLGDPRFVDALIRLKGRDGLYGEDMRAAAFLTPNLFRANIPLAARAPQGSYEVEAVLFAGGVPLARQTTNFEVVTRGLEQRIGHAARNSPIRYGAMTVALAMLIGWLAQLVFRRD
jgi:uncharacterized protein (TIGR02186 family)